MTNLLLNGNWSEAPKADKLQPFTVGINTKTVDKADKSNLSKPWAFMPAQMTMQSLADHHAKGHPWMPALLDEGAKRTVKTANLAYVLGADIDSGMTIAQALEHPFIKAHCGLGIESASSSPALEKLRLAFRLSEPLQGYERIELCNKYLIHLLGVADPSCKDASRYYFGASGRKPFIISEVATLPSDFEAQAKAWAESQPKPAKTAKPVTAAKKIITTPAKQTEPATETTSGGERRYKDHADFLNSVLLPAYQRLPIPDQYKLNFDPELREVSPGEWRGLTAFGDTRTNPDAFSVSVKPDGSSVWSSFSTNQGGNVKQFLCLQMFGEDTAKGQNFFKFLEFLSKRTDITIPEYLDEQNQERKIRKLLGDESANLYLNYPMSTPLGVQLQIEQVVMLALFSKPWLQSEGNLYRFNSEYYEAVDDATVSADVSRFLDIYPTCKVNKKGQEIWGFDFAGESFVKRCLAWVKMRVPGIRGSSHLICFKNCVLNVLTGEQVKHSPQWHLTSQIQSDYYRGAECPKTFSDFIIDAYGAEYLEVWQAIVSMIIDPSCMYGKAVYIVGQSGGGKGTTLRFLGSLLDPASVQSLGSFGDLATPEKRHQNLQGKKFAYFPDLGGYQQMLQAYYELVDNGSMSGRKLFASDAYSKQWHCRFALASVSELKIENGGDGWTRRTITLRVKNRKGKPDRTLSKKLEAVRSEVISWALSMSKERRDEILENPEIVAPAIARDNHQSSIVGDVVKTFLDSCFSRSEISDSRISNTELYQMYCTYYKVSSTGKPMALNNFVSHLKVIIPDNFKDRKKDKTSPTGYTPSGFSGLCGLPDVFKRSQDAFSDDLVCDLNKTIEGSFYTEFASTELAGETTSVCVESVSVDSQAIISSYVDRLLQAQDDQIETEIIVWEVADEGEEIRRGVRSELSARLSANPSRKAIKARIAAILQDTKTRKANGGLKPVKLGKLVENIPPLR